MAKSSKFLRLDTDVLLEFIYHDQSDNSASVISVDNSGSHIKFLNTVENDDTETRYLIHELGDDVVNFTVSKTGAYLVINDYASREYNYKTVKHTYLIYQHFHLLLVFQLMEEVVLRLLVILQPMRQTLMVHINIHTLLLKRVLFKLEIKLILFTQRLNKKLETLLKLELEKSVDGMLF